MDDQQNQQQSFGPLDSAQMIAEQPHKKHHVRMIIITLVVLLVALGGYIVLSNPDIKARMQEALQLKEAAVEENTTSQDQLQLFTSEITDRTLPWVEVQAPQTVSVGEEAVVTFQASSGGKDISGYDVLIGIDPQQFEVLNVTSATPDFQIQTFERGMYHAVTGYKNLQVTAPTIFENTALLTMTVRPKMKGRHVITVLATKDNERTQMIDKDVVILEPQVGSTFVNVN